jgi:hypothetical protein
MSVELAFSYPCDGLPATASPEMVQNNEYGGIDHETVLSSDTSLLHYYTPAVWPDANTFPATYQWDNDTMTTSCEFEVSFPRCEYYPNGDSTDWDTYATIQRIVRIGNLVFESFLRFRKPGAPAVATEWFDIFNSDGGTEYYSSNERLDTWTGKVVYAGGLSDIYLNDILVYSGASISVFSNPRFAIIGGNITHKGEYYVDLDYFNVWIDKPPPPVVHSFPWLGHFQLTRVTA